MFFLFYLQLEYRMSLDTVRCRTLQATIWECSRFQENSFLGAVTLQLQSLKPNTEITNWYPLKNFSKMTWFLKLLWYKSKLCIYIYYYEISCNNFFLCCAMMILHIYQMTSENLYKEWWCGGGHYTCQGAPQFFSFFLLITNILI